MEGKQNRLEREVQSGFSHRLSATEIAELLVALYGEQFGGKKSGKYRVSRKFLRQLAGRRRLNAEIIEDIADEMFERGLVLVDLETFFAVLDQRNFNSYRRVTAAAVRRIHAPEPRISDPADPAASRNVARSLSASARIADC